MRKLLVSIVASVLFAACTFMKPITISPKSGIEVAGFDFRKYLNKGFLFSDQSYSGPHQTLAVLNLKYTPDIEILFNGKMVEKHVIINYVEQNMPNYEPMYVRGSTYFCYGLAVEEMNMDNVLYRAYNEAVKRGGDAFVSLEIDLVEKEALIYDQTYTYTEVRISGTVIKRTSI
ncbi:hypothetical protein V6R21_10435 [Limibacter armeniacum]|uniref:hypothetical protein n=1 Tax=Limibacter armeniacum TaxID=466084 RepID=UPI002FE6A6BC